MGSASSLKLSDSVGLKTSSISQEFHHQRHSAKSRTQKRFSYCSPSSEPSSNNNNNNNNINYCNHIYDMVPRNASIYQKFPYGNNNANCAIKNVQSNHNASNTSTMLATNRFKSFENFMVSSSSKPLSSQLTEQRAPTEPRQLTSTETSEDSQMNTSGKLSMTKSLVMYDVDFEKFNRMPDQVKPGTQVVTKRKSTAVKATMTASSSIYQDLIDLDKDLEKRENHLKQQTSTTSSNSTNVSLASSNNKNNNINRNSSTSSSSSSSGCSSGASSLNVSRRKHSNSSLSKRIELSLHSVVPSISTQTNTTSSTGTTFINNHDHSSDIPSTALSTFNINSQSNSASAKASPSLFTQSSSSSGTSCSNKSILSSSCSSFSSPTEYLSPNNSKSVLTYGSKVAPDSRAQNRRGLFNKTKSECIYNENHHNQSSHHNYHQQQHQIVHHRHPHHHRDIKEASFYMKNFNTVAEHLQDQSLVSRVCEAATNSKQLKKSRDSGIIVDLLHLNGSMSNIKAKLSNAKINLRNSFSVFNLKQSAKRKKEKQSIQKQNSAVSCSSISRLRNDSSDVYESAASADTNATDAADAESDKKNQLDKQTSQENEIRRVLETHSTDTTANITKTNTISSSINSFLSNLAVNNTNNINNNNNCNLIKNSEKCLIRNNSNNLISIKNNLTQQQLHHHHHHHYQQQQQTSHPSNTISYKQIEVTNISKESNLNDVDCSTSNQNRSSNIHSSLSLSSSNLIASNNSNQSNLTDNKNNRLTRFSNSVKINDNKNQQQHEQQLQQPSNQQQIQSSNFIKRTITFHNTNSNTNDNNRNYFRSVGVTPASLLSSSSNESKISNMNNSKNINNNSKSNSSSNCAVNNSNIINNSTSFSFSSINSSNSNSYSSSDTSNTNSKLVNSKSNNISFNKNQIDNNHSQVPVIIEQNSRIIEPPSQLRHSTSVSSQKSAVLESNAAATAGTNVLPTHRHQKIVVQASTSDLLNCFAVYISEKCGHLINEPYVNPLTYMNSEIGKRVKFEPKETINWLRSADRALLVQGWQEIAFMNPVNVVFVYLLVRDTLRVVDVNSVYELQCNVMACLYLAFSYMGNEISYPLKPFLIEENREIFWQRTVDLMNNLSGCMLRINRDPRFFTELFYELKSYSLVIKNESVKIPLSISSSSTNLLNNININTNNTNTNNNNINNSSVISSSTSRNHHNSFKQLTDQINSIEIKIDSYTQQQNKHKDEQISSKNLTSHEKSSFNTFKPVLATDIAKVRSGLYKMGLNENEKPLSSYCV